jgi:hypothetical protein
MNDEQRAEAVLREISGRVEWEVGRQPTYRASLELACCIRVAAEDAAEVVRLLEAPAREQAHAGKSRDLKVIQENL